MKWADLKWSDALRYALTLIVLGLLAWWLWAVQINMDAATTKDQATGIVRDPYARAKETLGIVVPLVTLALGYWFGVKGADSAKETAKEATQQLTNERKKLDAVVAETSGDAFQRAVDKYPSAFGLR